ncbi:MAG: GIY-YIG nuclease family protein [Alphaproteobacteria bacterium]|nr:GIY-YIG nuclease family protein [Alphaproteobacteria bacterium]
MITTTDPDLLPAEPGAYLLMLHLDRAIALPPRFKGLQLPKGRYAYAGSAYGSGGIRARCRRHLLQSGVRHWHVDWLSHAASEVRAAAFPGNIECALINQLSGLSGVRFPVPGFGSTDCRQCPSHLMRIDGCHRVDDIATHLGLGR